MIVEGVANFRVEDHSGLCVGRIDACINSSHEECLEEIEIRMIEIMTREVQRRLGRKVWVELSDLDISRL